VTVLPSVRGNVLIVVGIGVTTEATGLGVGGGVGNGVGGGEGGKQSVSQNSGQFSAFSPKGHIIPGFSSTDEQS
jgi:hypothetical protein